MEHESDDIVEPSHTGLPEFHGQHARTLNVSDNTTIDRPIAGGRIGDSAVLCWPANIADMTDGNSAKWPTTSETRYAQDPSGNLSKLWGQKIGGFIAEHVLKLPGR
jgi:hypothetical protein